MFFVILLSGFTSIWFNQEFIGESYFSGALVLTGVGVFLKSLCFIAVGLTKIMDLQMPVKPRHKVEQDAVYLTILLGANFMVMSNHYLVTFIAIELVSIASYILVAFRKQKRSYEAAIKYLLFGAFSTAILLYGLSFIYGLTGSLYYANLLNYREPVMIMASLFFGLGLLFKLGAVPMHLWLPDVYEAASTPVVALLTSLPKLAGVGLAWLWLSATGLLGLDWMVTFLALCALASIVLGTTAAIWQEDPKRLVAYSSIAQTGFFLIGIVSFNVTGLSAVMFFGAIYLMMNYLVLYFIQRMEQSGMYTISSYSGQFQETPYLGVLFIIGLISLTGLPPTAGFTGKLLLFTALFQKTDHVLVWPLLIIGVVSTVVSLFFYLKMPYYMIFKTKGDSTLKSSKSVKILATILALPLFLLFIKSDFLLNFIDQLIFAP